MVQQTSRKILVVDDQPDILEAMRLLLKGSGFLAETACSPELALHAASTGDHDLGHDRYELRPRHHLRQ